MLISARSFNGQSRYVMYVLYLFYLEVSSVSYTHKDPMQIMPGFGRNSMFRLTSADPNQRCSKLLASC